jgi:GNAT superfamily N-acetyltransferase
MGIAAGAEAAGMDYAAMIARIVAAACAPAASAAPIARPPAPQKFRRETGPTDPDRVVALAEATKFFAGHEVAVARELAQAAADGDAHYRMLYADAPDGGLAGWACLGPTPCTEGAWDLYWVVVHPAAQGAGMGAALVAAASAIARAEGGRALYAETAGKPQYAPTRAFYARAGFRCQATLPDFYAPGDAKLVFARPLA